MEQLLQLFTATETPLSPDSSSSSSSTGEEGDTEAVREYLVEAISRLCRVMEADFIPYLGRLLPKLFAVLSIQPKVVKTEDLGVQGEDDDEFDARPKP